MKAKIVAVLVVWFLSPYVFYGQEQETEEKRSYEHYVFTESESAFQFQRERQSRFVPSVSTFASGGTAYFTLPSLSPLSWQFGVGVFSFADVPDRQYRGTLVRETALAFPMYAGMRYDLYRSADTSVDYVLFGTLIGGPVFGLAIPDRSGFNNRLEAMQMRWGGGGQVAIGLEVFFSERWAGYIQGGVDAVGFTRTFGSERGYVGPTIGIGFGRIIGR